MALSLQPDVILSDILLPRLNGYQILEKIRKNPDPEVAKIPFIFFSASVQLHDIQKGKMEGSDAYIVKPVLKDELIETIRKILPDPRRATDTQVS